MPHPSDIALTLEGPKKALKLSYWDLWFLLAAETEQSGQDTPDLHGVRTCCDLKTKDRHEYR